MQTPEKKTTSIRKRKKDPKIRVVKAMFRVGGHGKWQTVEIMCYGNPFSPPIAILKPGAFRSLEPLKM